jgi:hypothetical protein
MNQNVFSPTSTTDNKRTSIGALAVVCLLVLGWAVPLQGEAVPKDLLGDWSLILESKEPAWMSIVENEGSPLVYLRVHVGPVGPYEVTQVANGRLKFSLNRQRRNRKNPPSIISTVDLGISKGQLDGAIVRTPIDGGTVKTIRFIGKRIPPMPPSSPDLSKVRFGHPVSLFNGKDLSGWRTHESDKIDGWHVANGMMVNSTPKTDFSSTGAYANLRTEAEFEDFWLHIEFLIEEQRNSGVYLRGMYEVQVVDRDSRMQGIQGVGAIFGKIAPSTNAGNPGGQWQTYDLTLVDRHITVVLNGVKVIDNQPITGPTGGAIYTDPSAPGPIYLQGDHTSVKYKNIYLATVLN